MLIHVLDMDRLPQTSFPHQLAKPCPLTEAHGDMLHEAGHRVTEVTGEEQGTTLLWLYSGSEQG